MKNYKGTVKSIEKVAKDSYKLDILSELPTCKSGQFISILCPNRTLRRPFSIAGFKENITSVIFKLRGEGTDYLKNLKIGDEVDFIAPLGNGFNIKNKRSLLVGAGIGIAPMLFLKEELNQKNIENCLISGFKQRSEIIEGSDETIVGGSVLDGIEKIIKDKKIEIIYSCGPQIVLQLVSKLGLDFGIETQVALEKVMACSIGVCRGCVIKIKRNNEEKTASVCKDGPVFLGDEVIWG